MSRADRTVRVWEVLYHVGDDHPQAHGGPAGDGSFTYRSRNKGEAERFAAGKRYYSADAKADARDVPVRLARRWGLA